MSTYNSFHSNGREATCELLDKLEGGELDWEDVCRECLEYMSEDDVHDMAYSCEWLDEESDEDYNEDDDDDDDAF